MRLLLSRPIPMPAWPDERRPVPFIDDLAAAMHDTLAASFAGRPDAPPPFQTWWTALRTDPEFDPALCLIFPDGRAAAQSWTSGFIKDVAVRPNWRRRGLGEAMLLHTAALFHARGTAALDLKVLVENEPAIRLYERTGFTRV
jgi:ribosomal protein S18 acetylase RimI-like enzyme